ncbi:MAG: 2-amino-4-hydroxy-6-hydroxymethyldihydropteridine diphosphokinase [Betaproteobacteria bacterium]|nr:2-amino-4-hydroxy-6-hydroxymethyldihydropteridine diphosphokinase [Betaproteobacteria bacterium]
MHIAFIALGSNLGNPESKVRLGLAALAGLPQVQLVAASSLYCSAALGHADQPDFVNAVARLSTGLAPRALLAALLAIERRFGRERSFRNAPRTLDLDLLLYDAQSIAEPGLAVPHPRMHERAFVLAPLLEIAPACVIPGRGPAADWLALCANQPIVRLVAR